MLQQLLQQLLSYLGKTGNPACALPCNSDTFISQRKQCSSFAFRPALSRRTMPLGSAKWFGHRHGSLSSLTRFVWIICTWIHVQVHPAYQSNVLMRLLCSAQPVHARADLSGSFVQALQTGQFSLTIKLGPETATRYDTSNRTSCEYDHRLSV